MLCPQCISVYVLCNILYTAWSELTAGWTWCSSSHLQVFNFSLDVRVQPHSQPLGKAEQDMTKLCNHRRKVVAMAALCRSMQASQLPFVTHYQGN